MNDETKWQNSATASDSHLSHNLGVNLVFGCQVSKLVVWVISPGFLIVTHHHGLHVAGCGDDVLHDVVTIEAWCMTGVTPRGWAWRHRHYDHMTRALECARHGCWYSRLNSKLQVRIIHIYLHMLNLYWCWRLPSPELKMKCWGLIMMSAVSWVEQWNIIVSASPPFLCILTIPFCFWFLVIIEAFQGRLNWIIYNWVRIHL